MSKVDYMKELIEKLADFEEELVQEIVSDYEEHFANGAIKGKTEENVIAELGTVDELISELHELQQESVKSHVKMPVKKQEQEKTVWETQFVAPVEVVQMEKTEKVCEEGSQKQTTETKEERSEDKEQNKQEQTVEENEESQTKEEQETCNHNTWNDTFRGMGKKFSQEFDEAIRQAQKALDKIDLNEKLQQVQDELDKIDFNEKINQVKEKLDKIVTMNFDFPKGNPWKSSKNSFQEETGYDEDDIVEAEWEEHEEDDLEDIIKAEWKKDVSDDEMDEWEEHAEEDETDENEAKDWEREDEDDEEAETQASIRETVSEEIGTSNMEKCKHIVMDGGIADVFLEGTEEQEIKVEYENYGSLKDAMQYPFYSYQKEGVFYAGIKMNKLKKSGFFQFTSSTPHIELKVKVPNNLLSVEVQTVAGDIKASQLVCEEIKLGTVSGDMTIREIQGKKLQLGTKSGDMSLRDIEQETLTVSTMSGDICGNNIKATHLEMKSKSGDISLNNSKAEEMLVNAVSGDVVGQELEGKQLHFGVTSGDIGLRQVQSESFEMQSVSGDMVVRDVIGESMYASSVSGDVTIWAAVKKYNLSMTSGSMVVRLDKAAEVSVSAISGSLELTVPKSDEGYAISFSSTSGSCAFENEELYADVKENNWPGHRSKEITIGNGQYPVYMQSVSGSATVKVL